MTLLPARQIIFTRVEAEYSPQRKSGYQTVYHSKSLSPAEITAIEKRVQCFQSTNRSLVRHQFFILESGQIVLTHSIAIESHPQIVDQNRRGGVFLAHGLIFSPDEFEKVNNNPWPIFHHFNFINNAEVMVKHINQLEGREAEYLLELDDDLLGDSSWLSDEVIQLVMLAEQANALQANSQSILFYGSQEEINKALQITFWLSTKRMRLSCSFDTFIEQCMTPQGLYWAVGASSPIEGSDILINAGLLKIESSVPFTQINNMYIAWLQQAIKKSSDEVISHLLTVQELSDAFSNRRPLKQELLNEEGCQSFFALHETRIISEFGSALKKATSAKIGHLLAKYLLEIKIEQKQLLEIAASPSPPFLAFQITDWLCTQAPRFARLKRPDWQVLEKLGQQTEDNVLLFWAATFTNQKKLQQESLIKMNEEEFNRALCLLLNPIEAVNFVSPQHLTLLVSEVTVELKNMHADEFVEFVQALIYAGAASLLNKPFTQQLSDLDKKALKRLEKELNKSDEVPESFLQAVQRHRKDKSKGLLASLSALSNNWFRRKS